MSSTISKLIIQAVKTSKKEAADRKVDRILKESAQPKKKKAPSKPMAVKNLKPKPYAYSGKELRDPPKERRKESTTSPRVDRRSGRVATIDDPVKKQVKPNIMKETEQRVKRLEDHFKKILGQKE